jgi:hypothetical protein
MMKRLALVLLLSSGFMLSSAMQIDQVFAATTKKKVKSRDDYSAAERAKIMDYARKLCRKKYGASSTVYRLDYRMKRVTCAPPGY